MPPEEALARRREADDKVGVALILRELGELAWRQGEHRQAADLCEESRAVAQDLGNTEMVADALAELGHIAVAAGDAARGESLLTESLRLSRERESVGVGGQVRALAGLAAGAAARGQARRALRLGAAASALGETTVGTLPPADRAALDGRLALARQALPAEEQATAWAEGEALPLEQAVADALAPEAPEAPAPRSAAAPAAAPGSRPPPPLTRRETEVAALVARGFSNREIAAALTITERTAENHVEHILAKLGFRSRARIAAWAVRHGAGDGVGGAGPAVPDGCERRRDGAS